MTYQILLALSGFALVTSITPGPNNLMLLASGANYGFRRSIPHMMGVSIGFCVMVALVGVGLMGLFDVWPQARTALSVVSVTYMLWLAWKIAHARGPDEAKAGKRPMTFTQAALFQWVNPKGWAMALSAITIYAPAGEGGGRELVVVLVVAVVFAAVNLPSVSLWAWLGQEMRRFLNAPARLRAFNWTMAALLVASLYPILIS